MSSSSCLIISFDGGGIRGLLTSLLLQQMEKDVPGFMDDIYLFAGTSTGGIIALALASGLSVTKIVDIYKNSCSEIFEPYDPSDKIKLAKQLEDFFPREIDASTLPPNLLHVKYTNTGLKSLLNKLIGNNLTLDELNKKALVTTYQLFSEKRKSWTPLGLTNLENMATPNVKVVDAALATGAAELYFPPYFIDGYGYCVDGGTFANNPSTFALASIINLFKKNQEFSLDNVRLLSLGTGEVKQGIPPKTIDQFGALNYGIVKWLFPFALPPIPAFPLVNAFFDGSPLVADYQTEQFLGDDNYLRINPGLPESITLDDCGEIPKLEKAAENYIQSSEWQKVVAWLKQNFV